jgi:hypothetical protein
MPEPETLERAREDAREGKSPSTQAGEFVREEIHHVREGKHGARSPEQAIAIGLSKARRAGVKVPKKKGASKSSSSRATRKRSKPSAKRSRAVRQARKSARSRSASSRSAAAKKAAQTKGPARRSAAARKAARTRKARQ